MYSITSKGAPMPLGTCSQGTSAARFVFVSAQLPIDPKTGERVPGGIGQQTACCLKNVAAVLSELDLTLSDVTKTTVYLADLADFDAMDEVYAERFTRPAPARTCLGASSLPLGALVQIEAIACR